MKKQVRTWNYISEGIVAEAHTPIYKMHKYFARRPQNVFSALVRNYTEEGDTILDPFCGGGVSIVEGASLGRSVIGSDINPLAVLISQVEVTKIPVQDYLDEIQAIRQEVYEFSKGLYITRDRTTNDERAIRWYELAYTVICDRCGNEAILSNENKKSEHGKDVNGWYICPHCGQGLQAASIRRSGERLVSVTYKVTTRSTQKTVKPEAFDYYIQAKAEALYEDLVVNGDLIVPHIKIPAQWDRQQEDCLIRKGFLEFTDFFTHRSLVVMAFYLDLVRKRKSHVTNDMYALLLLTFSATLRYTNNMTISTENWQDGRPVAWAKHAYWLSNQFVEVNPIEYIDKRITAIKGALIYQQKKLPEIRKAVDFCSFADRKAAYWVMRNDSSRLPLPDVSVDMILTDPPYGGNVQYGELSAFWLSWYHQDLGITEQDVIDLTGEILIQRKNREHPKTHQTYYAGLKRVFSECYRVLKPEKPLVFTFNSKDAKVWLAVIKAVIDAGFILEPDGIIYQDPIEDYKNTAHTRAAGTVHGDFIYTFVKTSVATPIQHPLEDTEAVLRNTESLIDNTVLELVKDNQPHTITELYIAVLRRIIPELASLAVSDEAYLFADRLLSGKTIDNTIRKHCIQGDKKNQWIFSK